MTDATLHLDEEALELDRRIRQLQNLDATQKLLAVFMNGMQHGFFRFVVSGTMVKAKKREILIEVGNSYKFTIPEEELPS